MEEVSLLTLYQTENFGLFQTERVCRRYLINFMKMAESSLKWLKTLWEKEKLLVTSNFSFSHSVFKRLLLQTRKNQSFFEKGLNTMGHVILKMLTSNLGWLLNIKRGNLLKGQISLKYCDGVMPLSCMSCCHFFLQT